MKTIQRLFVLSSLLFAAGPLAAQDAEGCKDHPLFSRMPNYFLSSCKHTEFDADAFPVGAPDGSGRPKSMNLEGETYYLEYTVKEGVALASALQIQRNVQNAIKAVGGSVEGDYDSTKGAVIHPKMEGWQTVSTLKLSKNGNETWAAVRAQTDWSTYEVFIVERKAMSQDIVAKEWLDQINKDGWVEIAINFDTGKATIKPDSAGTVAQMVQLLKANPALKVEVGGHTDNVGDAAANLKLSEARAKAVMDALVKGGIAAARLTAKGYGQTMPVADNRREAGRAKNRRVELVKK